MRRRLFAFTVCALAAVVLAAGCASIDPISAPPAETGSADFTKLAVLGTSVSAGFQNNGLAESRQLRSYAALLAGQLGKDIVSHGASAAQTGEFVIPGYGDPGSSGTLELTSLVPAVISPITVTGNLVNTTYQAAYNNLGVPGALLGDALNTVTMGSANPFFDLVLRGQGTMLQQAAALQPTFVLVELGSNDVLGAVTRDAPTTPVATFEEQFRQLVGDLLALESAPKLAVMNVPEVTSIPFATTVPPFVVNPATNLPVLVDGNLVPLIVPEGPLTLPSASGPGDLVTIGAISLMKQGVGIPIPLGGAGTPLPDAVVVSVAELEVIAQRVIAYNQIIATVAAEDGLVVVDLNRLLREIAAEGVKIGGLEYTKEFVSGGVFSLDGVHPADIGHAILANEVIRTFNEAYGAKIPLVDLRAVAGVSAGSAKTGGATWQALSGAAIDALLESPAF